MNNLNKPKKNIAIFISGTGSNMKALIDATLDESYPATIKCIISDNPNAQGLVTAHHHNIKTYYINPNDYKTKQIYETVLHEKLLYHQIDFVCLAGFMRLISSYLCDLWYHKMVNIHPSLLPAFKGLNTHQRAIDTGVKFSGCTVHYVSKKMDSGTIIAQAITPVYINDTAETLSKRVLQAEHKIYPLALKALCNEDIYNSNLSFYDKG